MKYIIEELTHIYGRDDVHIHLNFLHRASISATDTPRSLSDNKYATAIRKSDNRRQRLRWMQLSSLLIDGNK